MPVKYSVKEFWSHCKCGDLKQVAEFADGGVNVHSTQERGLYYACKEQHFEVAKYLIEKHGAEINSEEDKILLAAIRGGSVQILTYLLEMGASLANPQKLLINAIGTGESKLFSLIKNACPIKKIVEDLEFRQKLLFWGCWSGEVSILTELEDEQISIVTTPPGYVYQSYVATACQSGKIEMVKFVLQKTRCDIAGTSDDRVLSNALDSGNLELIEWLLFEAKISLDNMPRSVVSSAYKLANYKVIQLLVNQGLDLSAVWEMHLKNKSASMDEADKIRECGININYNDGRCLQGVLEAAKNSEEYLMRTIEKMSLYGYNFEKYAAINIKGFFCLETYSEALLDSFISHGLKINYAPPGGGTVLQCAIECGNESAVQHLLDRKCDINLGKTIIDTSRIDGACEIFFPTGENNDSKIKNNIMGVSIPIPKVAHSATTILYDDEAAALFTALNYKNEKIAKILVANGAKIKKNGYVVARANADGLTDFLMFLSDCNYSAGQNTSPQKMKRNGIAGLLRKWLR